MEPAPSLTSNQESDGPAVEPGASEAPSHQGGGVSELSLGAP